MKSNPINTARPSGMFSSATSSQGTDTSAAPRRGASSQPGQRPPDAPAGRAPSANFHEAVRSRDLSAIQRLREQGHRPVQLDARGQSPLDALRADPPSNPRQAAAWLHALQGSLNPSAPPGYIKPDVFHGSPWGLEILASGKLIGGANDAKGGAQSLQGKVFFSGRTPLSPGLPEVRSTVRSKPRVYAKGSSSSPAAPQNRVQRHAYLTQVLAQLKTGNGVGLSGHEEFDLQKADALGSAIRRLLVEGRPLPARIVVTTPADTDLFPTAQPHGAVGAPTISPGMSAPGLPQIMIMEAEAPQVETHILEGRKLVELYASAAKAEKDQLEHEGKVPLLGALTGAVVPLVFGFERVEGLQTHSIHHGSRREDYAYQDDDHPLAGSAAGGKLKEVEVAKPEDISTLLLACLARGVALPADLVVRVKADGENRSQAGYINPEQLARFKQQFQAVLSHMAPPGTSDVAAWLRGMNLDELRQIHQSLQA